MGKEFICNRRPYRELQRAISAVSNAALQQFQPSLSQMSRAMVLSHKNQAGSDRNSNSLLKRSVFKAGAANGK